MKTLWYDNISNTKIYIIIAVASIAMFMVHLLIAYNAQFKPALYKETIENETLILCGNIDDLIPLSEAKYNSETDGIEKLIKHTDELVKLIDDGKCVNVYFDDPEKIAITEVFELNDMKVYEIQFLSPKSDFYKSLILTI